MPLHSAKWSYRPVAVLRALGLEVEKQTHGNRRRRPLQTAGRANYSRCRIGNAS